MATSSCPNCGTPRMGSFRFCRTCGLDYDAAGSPGPAAAPSILTPVTEATPATPVNATDDDREPPKPAGDVIVIQVQQLRLWAGAIIGGLVGVMLAGAVVVPFLGKGLVLVGTVAAILMVVASAWLGVRFVRLTTRRRTST